MDGSGACTPSDAISFFAANLPWVLADLYLAIEEYFGVEWPGDA